LEITVVVVCFPNSHMAQRQLNLWGNINDFFN
jgi:hypothetical protein